MNQNRLSTAELADLCREESQRYRRGRSNEQGDCFELFRLAIVERNQDAWAAIYGQYWRLVAKWVNHPLLEIDEGVNITFAKFWQSVDAKKFTSKFFTIGKVMAYLQVCAWSVKKDMMRASQKQQRLGSLEEAKTESEETMTDTVIKNDEMERLFGYIEQRLKNKQERLVVYFSFQMGLKPREIATNYAEEFADVKEVRRIKERVVLRLRHDPQLRAFWDGENHLGKDGS